MPFTFQVNGTMEGDVPADHYLWLMVNNLPGYDWWPQGGYSILPGETWQGPVVIGRDLAHNGTEDIGNSHVIAVALVSKKTHEEFLEWDEKGKKYQNWTPIKFPEDADIMAKVTVIRK